MRRPGHWWGDDWALYVRQAEAILGGRVGEVVADNRFTVERTGLPEFSPPMYPWGYALLLTPFVAVLGTDLDRLVVAQATFFCWFLGVWFLLARPRVGPALAFGGLVVLAASPQFVRWAELIQSELAFMALALTALVVLDRAPVRRALTDVRAAWWPPVVLGVLGALAFETRREGLAVMAAIAVAQFIDLARTGHRWRPLLDDRQQLARLAARLATPYAAALAVVGVLQVVLPATLVPGYEGNGVHNVVRFAPNHLGHVMETVGLQPILASGPSIVGSWALGAVAVGVVVGVALIGLAMIVRWRAPLDLPLVAFTVGALLVGGSFRMPGSRYLAVIGPMLLLLALVGIRELARRAPHGRVVGATGLALVALLGAANVVRAVDLGLDARAFDRRGEVVWGPDAPEAREMWIAVDRYTDDDAVVGFFKARAMTQRTDRRALQVDEFRPLARNLDQLTHVVEVTYPDGAPLHPEVRSTLDATLSSVAWSNPRFTLHTLHPAAN